MKKNNLTYNDFVTNIAQMIKTQIVNGQTNWVDNFDRSGSELASINSHYNFYSGVNAINLWITQIANAYKSNQWMTFKQIKDCGGKVLKGEKASDVFFFTQYIKTLTSDEPKYVWALGENNKLEKRYVHKGQSYRILVKSPRNYKVFNITQTDLKNESEAISINNNLNEIIEKLDPMIIQHDQGTAFYMPKFDMIRIPKPKYFKTNADYQATLLHELCHWTMKENRCNRTIDFASKASYAKEELIAEISATILLRHFGIKGEVKNHASYVDSWMQYLTDNDFDDAVKQAAKVMSYILNVNINEVRQSQVA